MFDSLINYMDKFGPELLVIQFGFLVILSTLFLWLWFSNRRKYHNLKHAIPANIVKSYLDSIIQNSTALKSSLFRGGGMEVNGVPSVMPIGNLVGGESIGITGAPSTAILEELNQKRALIASLESQLTSSQNSQRELESKLASVQSSLKSAEAKIKELEALLAKGKSEGGDAALLSELAMVKKERNEAQEHLKEFEIISDDLANLKRLLQENEQLKRSLAAQSGSVPSSTEELDNYKNNQADVSAFMEELDQAIPLADETETEVLAELVPEEPVTPEVAEQSSEESEANLMASVDEANESNDNNPKSEKSPEDLLSEFEKMLG